jgi:quercetin dioxygenase-like cupin family protein
MITNHTSSNPVTMLPGLVRRNLVIGQSMMICEFTFDTHVEIPKHSHPHEQVGYIVHGRVTLTITGQVFELGPGDSYCVPSNVSHCAYSLEPTVIIDTFSPPREDYL